MTIRWYRHWSGTCWFGFCPDEKTWNAERDRVLKKCHVDIESYPDTAGMVTAYRTPDPRFLITLAEWLDGDPVKLVGTLTHEAHHVVCGALRCMSEDEPGEEVVAHDVGLIASTVFEEYAKTRGKRMKELTNG